MEPLEFSEALRRVLGQAREEAARLRHEHVGTEHLLFALLQDSEPNGGQTPGVALVAIDTLGVDRNHLRQVLEQTMRGGPTTSAQEQLSYTSRARAVLEHAMAEARLLKHDSVRTEHLLLGLLREDRGVAAQVLLDHGVTFDKARAQVLKLG
jgi:ATP-dependent Clp protease ATP-binding subunit ClpC